MKTPYKITDAANRVYAAGISYHAHGVTMYGKTALFDFYQCDRVTDSQLAELRAFCPDLQVQGVRHKYAPEMQRVQLLFPKAAFYRNKLQTI